MFVAKQAEHLSRVVDAFTQATSAFEAIAHPTPVTTASCDSWLMTPRSRAAGVAARYELRCHEKPLCCAFVLRTSLASWRVFEGALLVWHQRAVQLYSPISTYICLYVKDLDQAEKLLADQPVELLDQDDFLHMTADIA